MSVSVLLAPSVVRCIAARGLIYFPLKLGAESDSDKTEKSVAQASMKRKGSLNGALSMGCTGDVSMYAQSLLACCRALLSVTW